MTDRYICLNVDDITDEIMSAVDNKNFTDLRFSLDSSKAVLKYQDGPRPEALKGITSYSRTEIISLLNTAEWTLVTL